MAKRKGGNAVITVLAFVLLIVLGYFLLGYFSEKAELAAHPIKYSEYVEKYSVEFGVPREILYSVILTESGFDKDAMSSAGAIGLMQITPDTYDWLLFVRKEQKLSSLNDPDTNIKYGAYFLSYLYEKFGAWDTVFAAYNAGLNRVSGWLDDPRYAQNGRLVNIPFKETENYVKKVNNAIEKYKKLYEM